MNIGILLAIMAGALFGALSLVYKYAEQQKSRSAQFTFVLSLTGAIITFTKSFFENTTWDLPALWILGIAMGVIMVVGIYILMAANRLGPVYTTWTVVNISFLFAIFLSAVFLKEKLLCVDPINLFLFGIMLFLFYRGMKSGIATGQVPKESVLHIVTLLGVFLTNGVATFAGKIKYTLFADTNTSAYAAIFYLVSALITLFIILGGKRKGPIFTAAEIKAGAMGGGIISIATILFLSAMILPAAAVFTITQGVSMIGGVALTTFVGKERLNKWMVLGIVMGLIVLFAVVFRDQTSVWLCR